MSKLVHGVVDGTDGMDCWHRRTSGGRSVTAVVSRHSTGNLRWLWLTYRLSVSSRQCHSVANSTADRLTVFVSRINHSPHCMYTELDFSPKFTALSMFTQQRLTWEVTRNRAHHSNTVAVTWLTVTRQQTGANSVRNWVGESVAGQCWQWRQKQRMHTEVQTVTGANTYTNM